jgi:hypothetical protein
MAQLTHSQEIRAIALEAAVRFHTSDGNATLSETVIDKAKRFETYIKDGR